MMAAALPPAKMSAWLPARNGVDGAERVTVDPWMEVPVDDVTVMAEDPAL
jgi:hypothetical protein